MAHSHDRTLLASLGFADPDKKDPDHDLACRYLARNSARLLNQRKTFGYADWQLHKVIFEQIITKGEGQYKSHIGFLDLACTLHSSGLEKEEEPEGHETIRLIFEVKKNRVPLSDVIRQLKLYREYVPIYSWLPTYWWLATCYDLSIYDCNILSSQNIYHLRLSEKAIEKVTMDAMTSSSIVL